MLHYAGVICTVLCWNMGSPAGVAVCYAMVWWCAGVVSSMVE